MVTLEISLQLVPRIVVGAMPFAPQDVAQSEMADESRIFKQAKVIGLALCMRETQVKIVLHLLGHVKAS